MARAPQLATPRKSIGVLTGCHRNAAPTQAASGSQPAGTATAEPTKAIDELSVAQAEALLRQDQETVAFVDANDAHTREAFGTLPNAILLESAMNYDLVCGSRSPQNLDHLARQGVEVRRMDSSPRPT